MLIVGFDLATRRCGWCAGSDDSLPTADAILLPQVGEDIGAMLQSFDRKVRLLHQRFPADVWIMEKPIKTSRDQLLTLRKLYSIAGHLEFLGKELGVQVDEADVPALKRELAGFSHAKKADMVYAAEKIGIQLPATQDEGREDAADAFAAWLTGVRAYSRRDIRDAWDRRLHSPRGVLL